MSLPARVSDLHARFCSAITHRYFIRAHMAVMLSLVLLSGLIASRVLSRAGVANMGLRYPASVLASYLVFFVLIRLWLAYVCRASGLRRRSSSGGTRSSGSSDGGLLDGSFGSSGGSGGSAGKVVEGGGKFGGGGSSMSFPENEGAEARAVLPLSTRPTEPSSSGGGSSSSSHFGSKSGSSSGSGGGGDGDGLLLLLLFALLVAAVLGAGAWLVYQAPVFLSEAAFQAALAGGLVRTARGAHEPGWMESVLKSTALPFALVLILAGVFGFEAHKRCPGASTVRQVFRSCILG